jgi:hypothetical protein
MVPLCKTFPESLDLPKLEHVLATHDMLTSLAYATKLVKGIALFGFINGLVGITMPTAFATT